MYIHIRLVPGDLPQILTIKNKKKLTPQRSGFLSYHSPSANRDCSMRPPSTTASHRAWRRCRGASSDDPPAVGGGSTSPDAIRMVLG